MNRLRLTKLLREITDGDADDVIRDIARACFQRRGVLNGDNYLMEMKRILPGLQPAKGTIGEWYHDERQVVTEPVFVGRVAPTADLDSEHIIVSGVPFDISSIIGKVYYSSTRGAYLKVVGLGKSRAKVKYLTAPFGSVSANRSFMARTVNWESASILSDILDLQNSQSRG